MLDHKNKLFNIITQVSIQRSLLEFLSGLDIIKPSLYGSHTALKTRTFDTVANNVTEINISN